MTSGTSLTEALSAVGEERLAGVGSVDAGRLAGDDGGGEGAQGVGPGGERAHGEGRRPRVMLAHVEVAVAMEFDDPGEAGGEVGRELVAVVGLRGGDEEGVVAGLGEPLAEVALVV